MSLIARGTSWLRVSRRRTRFEREMQDDMRTHLDLHQADLRRRGVPDDDARRRALAEFGSVTARQEECRDAIGLRLAGELRGDLDLVRQEAPDEPLDRWRAYLEAGLDARRRGAGRPASCTTISRPSTSCAIRSPGA